MSVADDLELALNDVLNARAPDGTPLYTPQLAADALSLLLLGLGEKLPPTLAQAAAPMVTAFVERVGIPEDADGPTLAAALTAHFDAHPLPPRLVSDLCRVLGDALAELSGRTARAPS